MPSDAKICGWLFIALSMFSTDWKTCDENAPERKALETGKVDDSTFANHPGISWSDAKAERSFIRILEHNDW